MLKPLVITMTCGFGHSWLVPMACGINTDLLVRYAGQHTPLARLGPDLAGNASGLERATMLQQFVYHFEYNLPESDG
ncbi:hypothetical protein PG996_014589 [Apiospora saccharicola]|uniref:Uncharacterized protein n=1 Tax=Apiospora saccharicola TaxID=335842 RepID=A0ABR1TIQ7_9PEZI